MKNKDITNPELLDQTRIHPDSYNLTYKICKDSCDDVAQQGEKEEDLTEFNSEIVTIQITSTNQKETIELLGNELLPVLRKI